MAGLMTFSTAIPRDPEVERWFEARGGDLGEIAREWYTCVRACGLDVRELVHDGCATACVEDVAFAYVNVFRAHVNLGFFLGALLPDPKGLLQGTGKRMRHVKLRPGEPVDVSALRDLVDAAYRETKVQMKGG